MKLFRNIRGLFHICNVYFEEMINFKERKKSIKILSEIYDKSSFVFVIHYSCESFYERNSGTSPRITSIAARNLQSCQTHSFSIHLIAEEERMLEEIESNLDFLEKKMLEKYFDFINSHKEHFWVHWNMRDSNYGFQAIEHRFSVSALFNPP